MHPVSKMNPKRHHVRYSRRIPSAFVASMDAHLSSLRNPVELPDALKAVLGEPPAKRLKIQGEGVEPIGKPAINPPYKDYTINFLKTK
jgi:hypothetical protein